MSRVRRGVFLAVVFLVAAAGAGCSGADDASGGADGGGAVDEAVAAQERPAARSDLSLSAPGSGSLDSAARLPSLGPSVIKTAQVELSVAPSELQSAVQDATVVAGRFGGFVASTQIDEDGSSHGTVVLRVPAESFEQALRDLRALGDVEAETLSGQDVSQEFVDLQARLRNWQSQEAVLLRLMDRSRSVSDTIRVQGELSGVQLQIERLRGRLNFLEDQTAFGTITATFTGGGAAPAQPTTLARAWNEAVDAALAVVAAIIVGAGFLVPLAVLAGIVLLVVRGLRPSSAS
ncbi:hypothetical protein BH24ACT26_BH24ACT26_03590 [soil metagenome]